MYRQFYQNLSEVASQGSYRLHRQFVLESTGNITEADQEDIDLFSNVAARVDYGMQVAQGSEIADIIRKRLFGRRRQIESETNQQDHRHMAGMDD